MNGQGKTEGDECNLCHKDLPQGTKKETATSTKESERDKKKKKDNGKRGKGLGAFKGKVGKMFYPMGRRDL